MGPTEVVPRQKWTPKDYRRWGSFVVIEEDGQYAYCIGTITNRKRRIKIKRLLGGKAYTYREMMPKCDFKRLSDPYRKY